MKKVLDIDDIMTRAKIACEIFGQYNQEKVDKIVRAVYEAGFNQRIQLARMACEETGIGKWEDKTAKNIIATRYLYHDIKDIKTAGIISENSGRQITEVAKPIGPIFAITPITNPTSTALFKILIALKTRNPIIIRPHGAAKKCTVEAARICYEAALKAGAPEDCIQWVRRSTPDQTLEMMRHKRVALVFATGSVSLVRAAYQSGNPAIGGGPGNVPVYIGRSADIPFAVEQIILSKTFDYGTICASEQSLIVRELKEEELVKEFTKRKAWFLSEEEKKAVERIAFNTSQKSMAVEVIGQPAWKIAEKAGFSIPKDTSVLIGRYQNNQVGPDFPLSLEILAPILALYVVNSFEEAISQCKKIVHFGGIGHTISIFSNEENKILHFAEVTKAGRLLVNQPASQGALGGTFNGLNPSLTLATGAGGKTLTTDNITVRHLMNIQRLARRKVTPCVPDFNDFYLDENKGLKEIEADCNRLISQQNQKK
ncbi:MAG: aldehyde dehydrogenase family protein [Bacteroidetes bacterium]|jgi:acetaldehyde dehydrogenase / alcohol dehydrogenase|nr:aldehyde dehydrogenase family protein [Bacteroidota bacterium]MBT3749114.1 aldehyde dehydrogenase family protein [Bacteroidota bacterium]MBT4398274.1 aldehyde dehydrogenase family protein [Bacteroidota bacterium]MBT4409059.1 aldehyde dehydrogenase family protein [Bacteroidota bacterium]MBT5426837.1 aldehyde dehydrogenase family protein [Bacteroidota bacterium]